MTGTARKSARVRLMILALFTGLSCFPLSLWGEIVNGKVTQVMGRDVIIALKRVVSISLGDKVELSYSVAGEIIGVGTWKVSAVNSDGTVEASPVEALINPTPGFDAVIHSTGDAEEVPGAEAKQQTRVVEDSQILSPRLNPVMVDLKGGCYRMGRVPLDDSNLLKNLPRISFDDEPQHEVCVEAFQIGKYEVTQRQWDTVMGTNPSHFKGCEECPVEQVSWDDVQVFIKKLNGMTGKRFRLPTESEWEYATRAGTTAGFSLAGKMGASNVNSNANHTYEGYKKSDNRGKTVPVGSLPANPWGLYEVYGNVAEWVQDCWNKNYQAAPIDGSAWLSGDCAFRVTRGGAWTVDPPMINSVSRVWRPSGQGDFSTGFRLAL